MYAILKELPKEIAAGFQVVDFMRKTTKDNPVADADKFRCVLVPAYSFAVTATPENAQQVFSDAIAEVVKAAASDILKEYCIANKMPEQMPEEMLTFAAVLEKMAASQTSERLNGEQITAWYDASDTKAQAATRYTESEKGQKQQASLRAKYIATASNNPGIDAQLAEKMLGYMSEKDLGSPVARAVAKKLERLSKVKVDSEEL